MVRTFQSLIITISNNYIFTVDYTTSSSEFGNKTKLYSVAKWNIQMPRKWNFGGKIDFQEVNFWIILFVRLCIIRILADCDC